MKRGRWTARLGEDPAVRRVLIMKWSALGDVALASAAMEDVCLALPNARVDLNTLPAYAPLFAHDPRFTDVIAVDVRARGLGGIRQWLREVRSRRYDAIVDLQSTDRSRLLVALLALSGSGPRYLLGNHRRWPYHVAPPPPPSGVHALEHLRATLAAAGVSTVTDSPVLHAGAQSTETVGALLAELGVEPGEFALFMPGCQAAGWLKRWGARRYAALAFELRRLGVAKAILVGAEQERDECRAIAEACPDIVLDACGRTGLLDLTVLARHARFVVANDTGTAHVAAAARVPMVVVCGPTDPRRVRPAGARVATLQAEIWCRSCYRKDCSHHSCMMLVSPARVLRALDALGAWPSSSPRPGSMVGR